MAQFDKHVYSSSDKLAPFGVPRGAAQPVTDVDVIYAPGPGQKFQPKQPFDFLRKVKVAPRGGETP